MNAPPPRSSAGAIFPQLLAGRHILVVEDETVIAFLIEDMLRELGAANISHAPNVAKALALLQDIVPHVALLDVNLGYELVYPVAAHLRGRSIPLIFASGYGKGGIATEWSAHTVLQKPFDTQTLGEALRGVLAP